nr:NADH dehydrogenase [ubiquinone] 1 alpha subcomplex subunit 11 [Pogona vitticeps]
MSEYWKDPEGTNCPKKISVTTSLSAVVGLLASSCQVVLHPSDIVLKSVQRVASTTLTMAAVGAIFGAVTCTTAKASKDPDSPLNYFAGGCAAGTMFGARAHSFAVGTAACVSLGTVATVVKLGKIEGATLFGPPKL